MRISHLSSAVIFASLSLAAPHGKRQSGLSPDGNYFPLQNGFPNPNRDGEITIQDGAHGTMPNGPPPPALSAEGITNLKLIALNELFEVAFFTELIYNVTNKVSGYDLGMGHDYMLDSLNAIVNQEELHVLNANGALDHFKQEKIQPCKYNCKSQHKYLITLALTTTQSQLRISSPPLRWQAPSRMSSWALCKTSTRSSPRTKMTGLSEP
jgi:hypothetical protein